MEGVFKKTERRGLPGGPNEMFTYTTGVFSTQGYKADSPDVDNPFNIIPSGNITMDGVEFPVHGVDNLGNSSIMLPGNDYEFPGDMVLERPISDLTLKSNPSRKNVLGYGFVFPEQREGNFIAGAGVNFLPIGTQFGVTGILPMQSNPVFKGVGTAGVSQQIGDFNIGVGANKDFINNPETGQRLDTPIKPSFNVRYTKTFQPGGSVNLPSAQSLGEFRLGSDLEYERQYVKDNYGNPNKEVADRVLAYMKLIEEADAQQQTLDAQREEEVYLEKFVAAPDNTRVETRVIDPLTPEEKIIAKEYAEARKKEQEDFEKRQWKKYDDASTFDAALDRTKAFAVDPLGMFARFITGDQAYFPGMGEGLLNYDSPEYENYLRAVGYTPGEIEASDIQNMINPMYWGASIGNNINKGNYGTAAVEGALTFAPFLPKGTVSMGNVARGTRMLADDFTRAGNYVKQLPGSPNTVKGASNLDDVARMGIDGNFITKPLTPFTRTDIPKDFTTWYRKIGGKKGLQDLLEKQGAQAPGPMRMKTGTMVDNPFFGKGVKPSENYRGKYAVGVKPEALNKYGWESYVGGIENYGSVPVVDGKLIKNLPLEDLDVYKRKWFSNNYKKLDPKNLASEAERSAMQEYLETAWKWGARAALADEFLNDGDLRKEYIEKPIGDFQYQTGREVKVDDGTGNVTTMNTSSQEYKDIYPNLVYSEDGTPVVYMPEIEIAVDKNTGDALPYYSYLTDSQKQWLETHQGENDPITRSIRSQAREGYGIGDNPTYGQSVYEAALTPFREMGTIVAEETGIPSAYRIYQDPMGTLEGVGNTLADVVYLSSLPGMYNTISSLISDGEFNSTNPFTGKQYGSGLEQTANVLGVIPAAGTVGVGLRQGLKKGMPVARRAYVNMLANTDQYNNLVERAAAQTHNMRVVAPSMKRAALRYTNAWRQPQKSLHFDYKKNLDEALDLWTEAQGNKNLLIKEHADEIDNATRLFEESRQNIMRTSSSFEDAGQKIKLLEEDYDEIVGRLNEKHKKAIKEYDDYFKENNAYILETEENIRRTSADPDFRAKAERIAKEGEYTPETEFEKYVDADAIYNPTFPDTDARTVTVTINRSKGPESLLKDPNFQKLSKYDQEYLLENYGDIAGVNTKEASITFLEDIEASPLKTIQDNVYENTRNTWNPKKIREAYEKEFQIENKLVDRDYKNKLRNFQETLVHESAHDSQDYANWLKRLTKYDPEFAYDITKGDSYIAKQFKEVLKKPVKKIGDDGKPVMSTETWEGAVGELHSELDRLRFVRIKDWINKRKIDTIEEGVQLLKKMEKEGSDKLYKFYDSNLSRHWAPNISYDKKKAVLQMLPVLTGFGIGGKLVWENLSEESPLPQQQQGGDIAVRDNTYVDIKTPQFYEAPVDNTRVEKKIVPEPIPLKESIDFEGLKKGIAQAESLGGTLMINPQSTATGLYGQRFSEIEDSYKGTREDFAKDTTYQEELFKKRFYEGLKDTKTTALQKDAIDLYNEYNMQFEDFPYSYEDIAALSNFLGRQGTREYFGYVLRDGKPLEKVFPTKYGPKAKQANKTPEEYLKITRPYYTKSDGGEILKVYADYINGVLDDTPMYKKGGRIYDKLNRIYYKDAKAAGMSSPNYIMTYLMN